MAARRASGRLVVTVAAACALVAAVVIVWAPWQETRRPARTLLPGPGLLTAPVAAGTSAANIKLNGAGTRVLVRWVARSAGTLVALHLRIQADGAACRQTGQTEYGQGDGGSWRVTTHPVLADGRPAARTLVTQDFRPCHASASIADLGQGIVRVALGIHVVRGAEYATVIANAGSTPDVNYTSTNFLYTQTGILGANGRNERSAQAPDAYYGLDPRELVGYSLDGGRSWALPGGPLYGGGDGRNFLPTYLQEYSDGRILGQPFYYASDPSTATRTMVFRPARRLWTVRALGAFTPRPGSGTLTLTVGGERRSEVRVSGAGMLRREISPVAVGPAQSVSVTASGLTIQDVVADSAWGHLAGMDLPGAPWRLEGQSNYSVAAPVYPLPAPPRP